MSPVMGLVEGLLFIKFFFYFPHHANLCINGHAWAISQAAKKGIGFTALDNGFAAVDDPARLQAICDRLGPDQIDALLRGWSRAAPPPATPGYDEARKTSTANPTSREPAVST